MKETDEYGIQLEESRVFTASSSLANATIYNSMCSATTTATTTASIFDSAQAYAGGSTTATSRCTTTCVDSRASVLADSTTGGVYLPTAVPSGSLSSHASLSSGQVFSKCIIHCVAIELMPKFKSV